MKRFLVTVKLKRKTAEDALAQVLAAVPDAAWISVRHDCSILAQHKAEDEKPAKAVDNAPA